MINNQNIELNSNIKLNIDKEELLRKTYDEKLVYTDQLRITYPRINRINTKILECYNSVKYKSRPDCMAITGPSGSGKTNFSDQYKIKYPDIKTKEGIEIPVLYSRIPCPAYIGGLAPQILDDMGDPFWSKRETITKNTIRLCKLIKECKVRIIFFDEVQHLVDRNRKILIRDSADWFKKLIDVLKIPIVFLGIEDAKNIFNENIQLKNRVLIHEETGPFDYFDKDFRKTLYLYDLNLPLKNLSGLADPEISDRIYLATQGYIKYIHDLISESVRIALENNSTKISLQILSDAFEKILFDKYEKNPFLQTFNVKTAVNKLIGKEKL